MLKELEKYLVNYHKYILFLNIFLLIGVIIFPIYIFFYARNIEENSNVIVTESLTSNLEENKNIYVDIKGEVKNPGLYSLKENSTLSELVTIAGGFTEKALKDNLNLSAYVYDEMVIEIPKEKTKNTVSNKNEKNSNTTNNSNNSNNTNSNSQNEVSLSSTTKAMEEEKIININTATLEELMTLKGIGESKALAIINYRSTNGLFKNITEIKEVKGIGEAIYAKIKDFITV